MSFPRSWPTILHFIPFTSSGEVGTVTNDDTRYERLLLYTTTPTTLHDTQRQDTKRMTLRVGDHTTLTIRVYDCSRQPHTSSSLRTGHVVHTAAYDTTNFGSDVMVCITSLLFLCLRPVHGLYCLRRETNLFIMHHVWYHVIKIICVFMTFLFFITDSQETNGGQAGGLVDEYQGRRLRRS